MRKAAISGGVIGLILLIAAALMAWWITPSYIARMPGGYNKTRTYDATISALFNPAALAAGNLAGAIRTDVPGTLTEHERVQQTSGNTALVQDNRTIVASGSTVFSPHPITRSTGARSRRPHPIRATGTLTRPRA